jgi:membrane protease YdiL (CAAX protease family)
MLYIPHICFIISLASCWFSKRIALLFYAGAIISGLFVGALHPLVLLTIPVLFGSLYIIQGQYSESQNALAHLCFVTLSFVMFFHLVPGISNFKIFDAVFVGEHCTPFTMYLNMKNGIIAFLLMYMVVPTARTRDEWKQVFVSTGIYGCICILSLMAAALASGFVKFNPKFPPQTFWFLMNNLMLVCMAEEAFFRGYIQKNLTDFCEKQSISKMFALVPASIVFGLCHYKGGALMIIFSIIAGFFYGTAYMRNNRIEAAILVHFSLNAVHFFFFSYPSFVR